MKKDLEEDLHLLSDGLNEAEGHRERTMAELELQESNRLQLQKVSHLRFGPKWTVQLNKNARPQRPVTKKSTLTR